MHKISNIKVKTPGHGMDQIDKKFTRTSGDQKDKTTFPTKTAMFMVYL